MVDFRHTWALLRYAIQANVTWQTGTRMPSKWLVPPGDVRSLGGCFPSWWQLKVFFQKSGIHKMKVCWWLLLLMLLMLLGSDHKGKPYKLVFVVQVIFYGFYHGIHHREIHHHLVGISFVIFFRAFQGRFESAGNQTKSRFMCEGGGHKFTLLVGVSRNTNPFNKFNVFCLWTPKNLWKMKVFSALRIWVK